MNQTNANTRELYLRLLSYVKPYLKVFILGIIATIFLALTEPLFPALLKPLLDGSFVEKNPDDIALMPILLILIFVIRGIAGLFSTVATNWVATRMVMDIRHDMYDRLLTLPNKYFDLNAAGNIISKFTFNVNQVTNAGTTVIISLVRDSVAITGLLAWMFYLDWKLSLIFFIIVPAAAVAMRLVSTRLRKLSKNLQDSMGDLTHTIEEGINGNRVIKIFGGQKYEKNRFQQISNKVRRLTLKFTTTAALNVPIVELLAAAALAFMIYVASLKAAEGNISVGAFVSLFVAMAMLFGPAKRLTKINAQIQQAMSAADSIFELIDQQSEDQTGTRDLEHARGDVSFDHIYYRYNESDKHALSDVKLDISAGETIALIGQSGSGKTTLANMIPRFYKPTEGTISIDGIDSNDIKLTDLRKNIALVSQDVILFDDTVANNIAYGVMQKQFTEEEIINAATAAHAMEFINKMPEGLQTQIGANGALLSGGQRQRLAIARAILKNAPILIFDEATSALDSESEQHIQQAMQTLIKGRTTIIIAHRLSTIRDADRIVVLEHGKIIEIGNHDALMEKNGAYARMQGMQG